MQHLMHFVQSRVPMILVLYAEQGVQAAGVSQCCLSSSPALLVLMVWRLYLVPGLTAKPGLCLGLSLCLRLQQRAGVPPDPHLSLQTLQ